jgi:hypothetical protein
MICGDKMRPSLKLSFIALLALGLGVAYASPMLVTPMNVQPFPRVPEGPKADFSVDIVYASFNPVEWQYTATEYDETGSSITKTYAATNVTYNVVLNVTNLSDQPATIYEFAFTAAEDVSVEQSILGGTLYDRGSIEGLDNDYSHFGGIVDGVYLNGNWVNVTWIPEGRWIDGKWIPMPYPQCLLALTQVYWNEYEGFLSGPLTSDDIAAFSEDHTINSAIPDLPTNASETGIWFEGVPITEYYDQTGNPLVTVMYINGSWVDVTGRVTVDKTQPFMVATNMLVDDVLTVGAQPYENWGNTTVGPITSLPNWSGGIGVGRAYSWLPFDWGNLKGFNNIWAPGESRLIMFNNTQMFIFSLGDSHSGLDALQTGNIKLYASVSNYIDNWPVNGTYYNTASTAVQVAQLQLENTPNGYVYNAVLADNQMFQLGISGIEVTIVPRIEQ